MIVSLICFAIGIAAYTVSQLQQHGKLIWGIDDNIGFWGKNSDVRKYSSVAAKKFSPPNNWYYRFFKIKYGERWPTSSTLTVFLTDGYHLTQFLFFLFISLSFVPILGWTYGIAFWILAHVIHFLLYRTLQR